jgi:hypothetical protein
VGEVLNTLSSCRKCLQGSLEKLVSPEAAPHLGMEVSGPGVLMCHEEWRGAGVGGFLSL